MIARLLVISMLSIAVPAMAADPSGVWVLRAGEQTLFRFDISHGPAGWTAVWTHPERYQTDGDTFYRVSGRAMQTIARNVTEVNDSLELAFDDPAPNATPDFRLRAIDAIHAEVSFVGFGTEPFALTRETKPASLGSWDPRRTYVLTIDRPTNTEMTEIFEADQKVRNTGNSVDWKTVVATDREHRTRTQALLDAGALNSDDDFYPAALVFQHGDKPEDYLKAHILATIAMARGKPGAIWISAATLDRYLQAIGRPQLFGTQFRTETDGSVTQDPYDRMLVSDALRQAMHVPKIADQEGQRRRFKARAKAAKP